MHQLTALSKKNKGLTDVLYLVTGQLGIHGFLIGNSQFNNQ